MVRRHESELSWYQKPGGKITVTKEEAGYGPAAVTEDLQVAAEHHNFAAEDLYVKDVEKQQVSVDASREVDHIPVKPKFEKVSDPVMDRSGNVTAGVLTVVDWPEPLPELVPKTVNKSGQGPTVEEIRVKGK